MSTPNPLIQVGGSSRYGSPSKAKTGHACSGEEVPTLAVSAMAADLPLNAVLLFGVHRTAVALGITRTYLSREGVPERRLYARRCDKKTVLVGQRR
jgi:hypothetical protein